MKRYLTVSLFPAMLLVLSAAPAGFTPFTGQMYGEASQGQPAHHSHQTLTVRVPKGMIVDTSAGGGSIACCGGPENRNPNSTAVPTGIAVEAGGGGGGEWGCFNIARDPIVDDESGDLTGYKLSADLYCGPSANAGGCNVHLTGSIKLKHRQ
jgi:hypothetical protein